MADAKAAVPKDLRWRINVGLVVIFAGLIFTAGIAWAQHVADDQFIGQAELKQNLQELESYSAEGKYLSQYYQNKSAARAYVQAYSSQLQEAADSASQKLSEHPHADALDDKVSQTISLANQLSGQFEQLMTEPNSQLPPHADQAFDQLSDQFQSLEAGL
jgi:Tfp pilus assembly protein PilO